MPTAISGQQLTVIKEREEHSKGKLQELRSALNSLNETSNFPGLTVIGAGSFARLEASEYSDIDMFFFSETKLDEPRTKRLRLFGKMIQVVEELGFPKFSRDCERRFSTQLSK